MKKLLALTALALPLALEGMLRVPSYPIDALELPGSRRSSGESAGSRRGSMESLGSRRGSGKEPGTLPYDTKPNFWVENKSQHERLFRISIPGGRSNFFLRPGERREGIPADATRARLSGTKNSVSLAGLTALIINEDGKLVGIKEND